MVEDPGVKFRREEEERRVEYQKLVAAEADDLAGRATRLHNFIQSGQFQGINEFEQPLLKAQLRHMQDYLAVLKERMVLHKGG